MRGKSLNLSESDENKFVGRMYEEMCEKWKEQQEQFDKDINSYRFWTLAGRYFGIDKQGPENQRKFWAIVSFYSQKLSGDSKKVVIGKYREIKSDIFTYSIMNLSAFEYLNLMTIIVPESDLIRRFDVDRIITVIYVMEVRTKEEKKPCLEKCESVFRNVFLNFKQYYKELFEGCQSGDILKEFNKINHQWEEEFQTNGYVVIENLLKKFSNEKKQYGADRAEWQKLDHLEKLTRIFQRIILDAPNSINQLENNKVCLYDYLTGVSKFKKFREEMEKSEDSFVKELVELCKGSKKYLSSKHYKTGVVKDGTLNEKSIEFLLGRYYSRKIRNTRTVRKKEDK